MKKKAKIIASILVLLLTSSLAIGLTTGLVSSNKNFSQLYNSQDEFAEDVNVKSLLNDLFDNNLQSINNYVAEQKLIKEQKIAELKLALTYFNPNWVDFANDGGITSSKTEYRNTRIHSSNILFYNLTSNWYWMIKNIDKFEFVNWPYKMNSFQKKGFLGTEDNESKEFVGDLVSFEATIDQDNKINFDYSTLEDGYVYEMESIHEKDKRSSDYPLHNFSFYERVVNKIKNWDNGVFNLKINVGTKFINKDATLNLIETETNKKIQIKTKANDSGLVNFSFENLKENDYKLINLVVDNKEVFSAEDLKNMQISTRTRKVDTKLFY